MAMGRGTVTMTGAKFMGTSRVSRPATNGNKRIVTGKQPNMPASSQKSRVAGVFAATHTGPYLGQQSL